ncbi:hypothetical protein RKD44_007782 [Streptomyces collinus]
MTWTCPPRTRGDDPGPTRTAMSWALCSPHLRDGPKAGGAETSTLNCSPHPRGWSPAGPAPRHGDALPPPRTRGDGPDTLVGTMPDGCCSPHPRGWSCPAPQGPAEGRLLPAPAGMVPGPCSPSPTRTAAPRTRGDGPPASGVDGGGALCSLRLRGWSPAGPAPRHGDALPPPALAGMVPGPRPDGRGSPPAPRIRGDGPKRGITIRLAINCSPHPWGGPPVRSNQRWRRALLPAPAVMAPTASLLPPLARPAPRTRGDDPTEADNRLRRTGCSPHPRGGPDVAGLDRARPCCSPHLW